MTESVFIDSGYLIALLEPKDRHRAAAKRWSVRLLRDRTPCVISTAVITELVDGFNEPWEWAVLDPVLRALRERPLVTIVDVDRALHDRAMEFRAARPDKGWGLTDCTSFVIMQDMGITRALSCDHHFHHAGFRALLIEE